MHTDFSTTDGEGGGGGAVNGAFSIDEVVGIEVSMVSSFSLLLLVAAAAAAARWAARWARQDGKFSGEIFLLFYLFDFYLAFISCKKKVCIMETMTMKRDAHVFMEDQWEFYCKKPSQTTEFSCFCLWTNESIYAAETPK